LQINAAGKSLDPSAPYRVTVNSFLADGGDGFTVLNQGTDRRIGEFDVDALDKYFQANTPVSPWPAGSHPTRGLMRTPLAGTGRSGNAPKLR
jgi:2',3'-cyclic-nucleotide 2'-phosphodiesterase (5'-nucleotidase family)